MLLMNRAPPRNELDIPEPGCENQSPGMQSRIKTNASERAGVSTCGPFALARGRKLVKDTLASPRLASPCSYLSVPAAYKTRNKITRIVRVKNNPGRDADCRFHSE